MAERTCEILGQNPRLQAKRTRLPTSSRNSQFYEHRPPAKGSHPALGS